MRLPTLTIALLLAACGGTVDRTSDPVPPAPTGAPTTDPPPVTKPGTPTLRGTISMNSSGDQLNAFARFEVDAAQATKPKPLGCAINVPGTATTDEGASAGDIVIELPDRALTLAYDASKRTYGDPSSDGPVPGGAPLHVSAKGGAAVPAFEATLQATPTLDLIEPAEGATIGADAKDLDISWAPTKDLVHVTLLVGDTTIDCNFEGSTGRSTIPNTLVGPAAKANRGCAGACTSILAVAGRTTHVVAGSYDVSVSHFAISSRGLKLGE